MRSTPELAAMYFAKLAAVRCARLASFTTPDHTCDLQRKYAVGQAGAVFNGCAHPAFARSNVAGMACLLSGYCSQGKLTPFVGDLYTSAWMLGLEQQYSCWLESVQVNVMSKLISTLQTARCERLCKREATRRKSSSWCLTSTG